MSTPSIQTLITQAQQVLNLKSSNEIRATLAAVLANANVGTPLNPNLTTQQLWDEFYEIVRQPSDDIMSIITDQMMRMVFSPPAPGGAGADKQVIFNDGGVLAGDTDLIFNKALNKLVANNIETAAGLLVGTSATITGDLTVDTNVLKVDTTNNRVGIGTASPTAVLTVNGEISVTDNFALRLGSTQAGGATLLYNGSGNLDITPRSGFHTKLVDGNLIIGTSGKGIDFSATASGSGTMTSELLNDYEEGTWEGTITGSTTNPTIPVTATGQYTKIGRQVNVQIAFEFVSTVGASGNLGISGLPFVNSSVRAIGTAATISGATFTEMLITVISVTYSTIDFQSVISNASWANATHNAGTGRYFWANVTYTV